MKIEDLIGETTVYDKKRELKRKDPLGWPESVSAFANDNYINPAFRAGLIVPEEGLSPHNSHLRYFLKV